MGLIDSMAKNETNKVGRQLVDARVSGAIPWAWIVDETRSVEAVSTWADPARFADTVTRAYRRNKWGAQPVRVELWSEKGTVRGTLAPVLDQYEVPFRVLHGFASAASLTSEQPTILRVALAAEDVRDPALPSFPVDTKRGDPRHGWYREEGYGARCWELDALSPVILRERIEAAIVERLDRATWDRYVHAEAVERESIVATVGAWRDLAGVGAGA